MKILLFLPSKYSLVRSLDNAFRGFGFDTKVIDYRKMQQRILEKFLLKSSKVIPRFYTNYLDYWIKKINQHYVELIKKESPDLVFIYNDELFDPEVLSSIKNKTKIVFFLGDNPINYSPGTVQNINLLFYADYIICPDSFWIEQLSQIGIKNLHFDLIASDSDTFFKIENGDNEKSERIKSDLVFIGRSYQSSWGYKRALFLSKFCNFDFRLFATGKGWEKWFDLFPELKKQLSQNKVSLSFEEINRIYNSSKINLVDSNAGIPKGVHIRILDSLASGILPMMEYGSDIERVFPIDDLPIIKNYDQATAVA